MRSRLQSSFYQAVKSRWMTQNHQIYETSALQCAHLVGGFGVGERLGSSEYESARVGEVAVVYLDGTILVSGPPAHLSADYEFPLSMALPNASEVLGYWGGLWPFEDCSATCGDERKRGRILQTLTGRMTRGGNRKNGVHREPLEATMVQNRAQVKSYQRY